MDPKVLKALAKKSQQLAAQFAPLQNDKGITLPSSFPFRVLDQIRYRLFGYRNKELTPRFVADVTNALLSAGNILESVANGKIVIQSEEETTRVA